MDKNISTLLSEIKTETGWSETRISKELGEDVVSQPTVNRILRGQRDCLGSTKTAIENLYKRVCIDAVAKVNRAR